MTDVPISKFRAKCFRLIEEVSKTHQPLRITRRGIPAEVVPPRPKRRRKFLGGMIGTGEILGDIVSPVIDLEEIEAYR